MRNFTAKLSCKNYIYSVIVVNLPCIRVIKTHKVVKRIHSILSTRPIKYIWNILYGPCIQMNLHNDDDK